MSSVIHLSREIKFVSGKDIPVIKSMQCLKEMNKIKAGGEGERYIYLLSLRQSRALAILGFQPVQGRSSCQVCDQNVPRGL